MATILKRTLRDKIFLIALTCAIMSLLIGTPSIQDINWTTIGTLFALMLCVQLLRAIHLLNRLSDWLLQKSANTRQMCQFFILLAFGGAMLLTNDVAILTLIPLFTVVARQQRLSIAYPVTLMVMAANLGSAFTPIGNPQNLFLVTFFHVNLGQFFQLSTPLMLASLGLLLVLSHWLPRQPLVPPQTERRSVDTSKALLAGALLILIMAGIFGLIPIWLVVLISMLVAAGINRQTFYEVDYTLLLTFICFFVFVSAISHNTTVMKGVAWLTQTPSTVYLTSILTSQVISNVPAVILLAHFTQQLPGLFIGVNIGGLGSLVASLANLLALKQLSFDEQQPLRHFLKVFTGLNLLALIILGGLGWLYLL